MKRTIIVWSSVTVILVGAVVFLFRTVSYDRAPFGKFRIEYRWGKPKYLLVDLNRDGKDDYVDLLPGRFTNHTTPLESWVDTDFDGVFDIHIHWDNDGSVATLDLLRGPNMEIKETLAGSQAREEWEAIRQNFLGSRVPLR